MNLLWLDVPSRARAFRTDQNQTDSRNYIRCWTVLPEPLDRPASLDEICVGLSITRDIAIQFLTPPNVVRFGTGRMGRAGVPEATINEDGNASTGEGNVDGASGEPRYWVFDSVSKAHAVQFTAHTQLGVRAHSPLPGHPCGDLRRGCNQLRMGHTSTLGGHGGCRWFELVFAT